MKAAKVSEIAATAMMVSVGMLIAPRYPIRVRLGGRWPGTLISINAAGGVPKRHKVAELGRQKPLIPDNLEPS